MFILQRAETKPYQGDITAGVYVTRQNTAYRGRHTRGTNWFQVVKRFDFILVKVASSAWRYI